MADDKAGGGGNGEEEARVKMDADDPLKTKDHGFGDIVTLNVGGKR